MTTGLAMSRECLVMTVMGFVSHVAFHHLSIWHKDHGCAFSQTAFGKLYDGVL